MNIVSLRVGWIINEPEGKEFFKEILGSDNIQLYNIKSLQIIIEFLFSRYKVIIFLLVLPLYIFNFYTYTKLTGLVDYYYNDKVKGSHVEDTEDENIDYEK